MSYRPLMDGKSAPNVYDEHEFKLQVTFGASSAVTYYGKDVTFAKTTTTTFTLTLPQPYNRITSGYQLWKKATGADPIWLQVTTDNTAVDGTIVFTSVSLNSAGTATAPANGDVVWLTIGVSDHDANQQYSG